MSDELDQATPSQLAIDDAGPGSVGIYAAAAGVMSAIPIPFLDSMLASLARGAAMRRVAARHGVRLEPDARDILASGDDELDRRQKGLKFVRSIAGRFLAPLRLFSRMEESLSAFAAASLFDHYLRTSDRRPGAPVTVAEARRVRAAMKRATGRGVTDALKGSPLAVANTVRQAYDAATSADPEGRGAVERVLDAVLDGIADAPEGLSVAVRERFDSQLADSDDGGAG